MMQKERGKKEKGVGWEKEEKNTLTKFWNAH